MYAEKGQKQPVNWFDFRVLCILKGSLGMHAFIIFINHFQQHTAMNSLTLGHLNH